MWSEAAPPRKPDHGLWGWEVSNVQPLQLCKLVNVTTCKGKILHGSTRNCFGSPRAVVPPTSIDLFCGKVLSGVSGLSIASRDTVTSVLPLMHIEGQARGWN